MELVGFLLYATTVPELDKLRFRKNFAILWYILIGLGASEYPHIQIKEACFDLDFKSLYKKAHGSKKE